MTVVLVDGENVRRSQWPNLGRRERAILDLYADGLRTAEIAELLVISPHTVRTHVKHAMRKLGVHTREEAAQLVRTNQMLQLL